MPHIADALEEKRKKLNESQSQFCKRVGLEPVFYSQIKLKSRSLPKEKFPVVAKLLGVSEEALYGYGNGKNRERPEDRVVSAEQLQYLAKIAEAAGKPLPFSLLLKHLDT